MMKRRGARAIVAVWVMLLGACGDEQAPRERVPTALPQLQLQGFLPAVRDEVQQAYDQVEAEPNDPGVNGRLGMVLHAHQRYEAATPYYRRARDLEPSSFRWAYYLGVAQSAMGAQGDAAETLHEALRLDPSYQAARLKLAEVLLEMEELAESRRIYDAALNDNPRSAAAFYGLGRLEAAQGKPASAIEYYSKACELYEGYGAAHYALALAYRDLGQAEKAERHLELYRRNESGSPPLADPLLDTVRQMQVGSFDHVRRGVELTAAGRFEEAAKEFERALEIDPREVAAHTNLIIAYGYLGRLEKAKTHYQQALKINPDSADSHFNFGVILANQQKYPEAAEAFGKVLEINPTQPDANTNLGFLLEQDGKLDDALRHYRKAIESVPNHSSAHFRLGRLLLRQNKTKDAIEHFQAALQTEDENTVQALYGLATAHAITGDFEQALNYGRRAHQLAMSQGQKELAALIESDLKRFQAAADAR